MDSPGSTTSDLPARKRHEIVWIVVFVASAVLWWLIVVGIFLTCEAYVNDTIFRRVGDGRVARTIISFAETALLTILVMPGMFFMSAVIRYELGRLKPASGYRLQDHSLWKVFWTCVICTIFAPFYDGFIIFGAALFVAVFVFIVPVNPWLVVLTSSAVSFSIAFLAANLDNDEFGTDESE